MPNKAVQFVQFLRSTKREKRLGTVILFVTSRCNAFCQTCFYHEELNQPGDLTFAQIEKVSRTMPPITDLWLSGGEPTLRRDLSDIIDLFVSNNGVNRIIIPTNGLIKSRVYDVVDRALGNNPEIDLYLNIALDGYGETHDRIRGVPGNWEKALECIESLYPLKEKYTDRFRLNVNTVVCAENYTEIEMLSEFMWENYRLDGHYFNIIRGETLVGEQIKQVPPEVLPAMYAHVSKLTKRYGDRCLLRRPQQALCEECCLRGRDHHSLPDATRKLSSNQRLAFPVHRRRDSRGHRLQRRRARVRAARKVCNAG